MTLSSHRLRAEEKKLFRKIVTTSISLILVVFIFLYAGVPLLVKIVIGISTLRSGKQVETTGNSTFFVFPPVLDPLVEATNSSFISISGFAEMESKVKIFINDKESTQVTTNKEGKFMAPKIILTEGENIITARTIKDNQQSSLSAVLNIVFKKTSPKLEITSPKDGDKFSSDTKEIEIIGETDPGNRVTVNDRFVIVDLIGKFQYKVSLSEGDNNFKITAFDNAGNKTEVGRKVTLTH